MGLIHFPGHCKALRRGPRECVHALRLRVAAQARASQADRGGQPTKRPRKIPLARNFPVNKKQHAPKGAGKSCYREDLLPGVACPIEMPSTARMAVTLTRWDDSDRMGGGIKPAMAMAQSNTWPWHAGCRLDVSCARAQSRCPEGAGPGSGGRGEQAVSITPQNNSPSAPACVLGKVGFRGVAYSS